MSRALNYAIWRILFTRTCVAFEPLAEVVRTLPAGSLDRQTYAGSC